MRISLTDTEAVFAALAHQARREILLTLSHLGGELPSGYLAARFHVSWPTTTRHLGVLVDAGLIEVRREGRSSFYRLNRERLTSVVEHWLRLIEPVDPTRTWTSTGPKSAAQLGRQRAPTRRPTRSAQPKEKR